MVTAKTQYNLKNAKEYFEEHLCVGDYYDEGQRVAGEWAGLGADRLGLSGKVGTEAFLRLCENRHVTISRGRRGVRIFTPDKIQFRENLVRSGHRPLALEFAGGLRPRHGNLLWNRLHDYLLRFGQRAADTFCRLKQSRRHPQSSQKHEQQITRMLRH